MKLKVNPNRMVLLNLKKRLLLAKRGHKLLKDKEEQLLIEFRSLIDSVKKERKSMEEEIVKFYLDVLKMKGLMEESVWKAFVEEPFFKTTFSQEIQRFFNIPVPKISFNTSPEKFLPDYSLSPYHYYLLEKGREILKKLLYLSFLENKLISFAIEIERTRRRVNALEYVLMPNIKETIRFITFKLNEAERASLVMLKHIQLTR
ncbi:MAG: V-type ATP synthase subunit D [Candidatus Ratteibacteria bacterium]|nr:V-type ATP synthase subunit D [Candidatus Ratteibacteria bacterium]